MHSDLQRIKHRSECDLQIQSRCIWLQGLLQEFSCEITVFDLLFCVIFFFFFFAKVGYPQLEGQNVLISK